MAMYTSDGTKIADTPNGDIVLPNPKEVEELRRIADSLAKEVETAKVNAAAAREEAKKAKRHAIISHVGAAVSFILAIAALIESILADIGFMATLFPKG